ncbi:MAG TPA: 23S rRNA (uracil(1939)-C(5))-methyltransferase RlmD, partial [Lachnospiraceae bacterium]|nr:23S rRNA (uracil(1939)-C(5))-methyltransferase RlmD [Lachnospiraceae bacterium]
AGEGMGRVNGYTLFVKDAVIGDQAEVKLVKVKKRYAFARLETLLSASPYRVDPPCPIHRQCGGCQIQALSYAEQLRFKEKKVQNHLIRLGGFQEAEIRQLMEPVIGMEERESERGQRGFGYRNKAQFPVGRDKEDRLIIGFYAGRTHSIIPNTDCLLGLSINAPLLKTILSYMEQAGISAYDETTGTGLVRHILLRAGMVTGEVMVCLVINGKKLPQDEKLVESLLQCANDSWGSRQTNEPFYKITHISFCVNTENTNVIMGNEIHLLYGKPYIRDMLHGLSFHISPLSFYQVNPVQAEKLYAAVLAFAALTGTETVWDLYCGIGTISLCMARNAKQVYGVEIIPQAIADAKENAARNQITNAEFFAGKAEEILPRYYTTHSGSSSDDLEGAMLHPDVIVVDPPRKGCDMACLETMLKMEPDRIVYVSCDSATLARDLKFLCSDAYELKRIRPCDMFCQTVHVEVVTLLSKK